MSAATLVQSERQFQTAVVEYAEHLRWLAYHTFDSRRSKPGFPDLVLLRPPRLIIAELKTEKGRVKPDQREWLDGLAEIATDAIYLGPDGVCPIRPVEVHVWRPSDWPEIGQVLR